MQKILTNKALCSLVAVVLGVLSLLLTGSAFAEPQTPKSPFGIQVPGEAQAAVPTAVPGALPDIGIVSRSWNWLLATQSALNKDMAASVRNLHSENPVRAALALIAIAFAYGVLHAAGPGHGKSVISSYVLSNKETVRRGIALSFLSAIFQAVFGSV